MEGIYKRWGIKTGINARTTWMTSIGGSIMLPEVRQAMVDAPPYFVDMQELNRKDRKVHGG